MLNPFKIQDRFSVIQMLVGGHITYHTDDNIIYHNGQTPPTEKEITDKMAEIQAEYDAQEYARKREDEYPSLQELVVRLYDPDDKAAIDVKRAAVKAKYPKPE